MQSETWYNYGKRHREDGPAKIWYEGDGSVEKVEFRLRRVEMGFWEFFDKISPDTQKILLKVGLPYV